jgi:hypothetical protein
MFMPATGSRYLKNVWNPKNWDRKDPLLGGKVDALEEIKFSFVNKSAFLHAHLNYFKALAAEQKGPYTGKSKVRVPNYKATKPWADVMSRARVYYTKNQTQAALLRVEVALRRYHAANGKYPDHLSDLKPVYLKSVPIDPFGGKQLRYRSLNGGKVFLLYSIGPNLMDDKGKPGLRRQSFESGDIVVGKCY